MKRNYFTLAMAFAMALALAGCTANRDVNSTDPVTPTNTVSADQNDRPSAEVGGGAQNTPDVNGTGVGDAIDDIGDAAGDVAQGAGNAAGDAGNAIGDAANGTGTGRALP